VKGPDSIITVKSDLWCTLLFVFADRHINWSFRKNSLELVSKEKPWKESYLRASSTVCVAFRVFFYVLY
jgi:hypothetical protein